MVLLTFCVVFENGDIFVVSAAIVATHWQHFASIFLFHSSINAKCKAGKAITAVFPSLRWDIKPS